MFRRILVRSNRKYLFRARGTVEWRLSALVVSSALLLQADSLQAQLVHRIEASPVAGFALFTRGLPARFQLRGPGNDVFELNGVGLNPGVTLGGHLSAWLTSRFALEASALFVPTGLHGGVDNVPVDVSTYALGARWLIVRPGQKWQPFLAAGAGAVRYDFEGDMPSAFANFAWSLNGGLLAPLAPDIRLRIEARDVISQFQPYRGAPGRVQHDLIVTAGFDLAVTRRPVAAQTRITP
jgi:hypothetical protein